MSMTRRKARKGYICEHHQASSAEYSAHDCGNVIEPGDDYVIQKTVYGTGSDFHPARKRYCLQCASYMANNFRAGPIEGLPACPECGSDERVAPTDVDHLPDWRCFECTINFDEEGQDGQFDRK